MIWPLLPAEKNDKEKESHGEQYYHSNDLGQN
jgi:hypothetical protein